MAVATLVESDSQSQRGANLVIANHVYSNIFEVQNMPATHLLVHPHQVVCPVIFPDGVLLLRLVVGDGVRVTQFVNRMGHCTIHVDVYGDTLLIGTTIYPSLMVVQLSM